MSEPVESSVRDAIQKRGQVLKRLVEETPRGLGGLSQNVENIMGASDVRIAQMQQLAVIQAVVNAGGLRNEEWDKWRNNKPFDVLKLPDRSEDAVRDALKDVLKLHGGTPQVAEKKAKELREILEALATTGTKDHADDATYLLDRWDKASGATLADKLLTSQLELAKENMKHKYPDGIIKAIETLVPIPPENREGKKNEKPIAENGPQASLPRTNRGFEIG